MKHGVGELAERGFGHKAGIEAVHYLGHRYATQRWMNGFLDCYVLVGA